MIVELNNPGFLTVVFQCIVTIIFTDCLFELEYIYIHIYIYIYGMGWYSNTGQCNTRSCLTTLFIVYICVNLIWRTVALNAYFASVVSPVVLSG